MGRPRSFDETDVIERAMDAFWRYGYDATPIGALETATGISRISIYNTWGDKEGLFLAALDRYHAKAVEIYDGMISTGGLDEIAKLFDMMSAETPKDGPANFGCLMVNTVLDIRRASEPVRGRVASYRAMLLRAFRSALGNARARGEMAADDAILDDRAALLTALLWGALATIRVETRTTAAAPVAAEAKRMMTHWRDER